MAKERIGTLVGDAGRPVARVKIVRLAKPSARVRRAARDRRGWDVEESVPRERVLFDNGAAWEAASFDQKSATYLDAAGEPAARLRVVRCYRNSVRVRFFHGQSSWGGPETVPADRVRFDSGRGWGWRPSAWVETTVDDGRQSQLEVEGDSAWEGRGAERGPRGQRVGYLRLSSADQNEARQREAVGECDKVFVEKASARSRAPRAQLAACIDYLREHDVLVVASMDRLARSLVDLKQLVDEISAKGASVHFVGENTTYSAGSRDPRDDLMLSLLGAFAEFERAIIRERQAEGIAIAKKAGKYTGRKRALTAEQVDKARARIEAGETAVAVARDLGVGRSTLYRSLAQDRKAGARKRRLEIRPVPSLPMRDSTSQHC